MGSEINLEKIKQVHRRMMALEQRFAEIKAECNWLAPTLPRQRQTYQQAFEDQAYALSVAFDTPNRPMRVKQRPLADVPNSAPTPQKTLVDRLKRGVPLAQAFNESKKNKAHGFSAKFTIEGRTMNLRQWAAHYKINVFTVRSRLNYGWQIIPALTVAPKAGMGRARNGSGGWVRSSADGSGTGGVGSRDTKAKQDFFQ